MAELLRAQGPASRAFEATAPIACGRGLSKPRDHAFDPGGVAVALRRARVGVAHGEAVGAVERHAVSAARQEVHGEGVLAARAPLGTSPAGKTATAKPADDRPAKPATSPLVIASEGASPLDFTSAAGAAEAFGGTLTVGASGGSQGVCPVASVNHPARPSIMERSAGRWPFRVASQTKSKRSMRAPCASCAFG